MSNWCKCKTMYQHMNACLPIESGQAGRHKQNCPACCGSDGCIHLDFPYIHQYLEKRDSFFSIMRNQDFFFWQSINLYIQSPLIWIFKIRKFWSMACTKIYILMHEKMRKKFIACCLMDLITNLCWDITRLQSFEEGRVTHDVTRHLGLNSLIQKNNSKVLLQEILRLH